MSRTKRLAMLIAAGAIMVSAVGFTSCASTKAADTKEDNIVIGMANPFVDSATLEEASSLVGFSIELPTAEELPDWVIDTIYRSSTVNTKLLEIIYPGDKDFKKEIRIRKAITDKEDMSGDYTSYESEEILILDDKTVNAKYNGDTMYLATWEEGDYSYSVRFSEGATTTEFENLISIIK